MELGKICSACGEYKLFSEFYKSKRNKKDGHRPICKVCANKYSASHNKTDAGKYNAYKSDAKRFNKDFKLTKESFFKLINSPCHYCGTKNCRGVDRIDSSKGYIEGNVRPCCFTCNSLKSDRTESEFFDQLLKIVAHLKLSQNPKS